MSSPKQTEFEIEPEYALALDEAIDATVTKSANDIIDLMKDYDGP